MVWETKKKINERGKHDGSILRQNIVGILPLILETARMITYYGHDIAQHCPYQYRFIEYLPTHIRNIRISSIRPIKHLSNSMYPQKMICTIHPIKFFRYIKGIKQIRLIVFWMNRLIIVWRNTTYSEKVGQCLDFDGL